MFYSVLLHSGYTSNTLFTPKRAPIAFCIKAVFVYFKFITLKVQAGDYLNLMENLGFKFSVSDFHSVKFGSTKHVVLV